MSSILEEIETQIAGLKTSTTKSNVGIVRETGDGVARIEGLSDVIAKGIVDYLDRKTDQDMRRTRFARMFQNIAALVRGHIG